MQRDPNLDLPWRGRSTADLTDIEILEHIYDSENTTSTICDLSESRRSKSRLRLQCRYMVKAGLLFHAGNESFTLTEFGQEFLGDDSILAHDDGYLNISEMIDLAKKRISDFGGVSQEYVKKQNYEYFDTVRDPSKNSEQDYSVDARDPRRKEKKVLSAKKWKIDRIIRELPRTEPVVSQCAHWMTSIAGLHLFPDANHRTAMITLYALVLDNEIVHEDHRWPGKEEEIGKAVLLSKYHRYLSPRHTFDRLWRRDTLYWHWYQYFEYLLNNVEYPALNNHSEGKLRRKLQLVRSEKN